MIFAGVVVGRLRRLRNTFLVPRARRAVTIGDAERPRSSARGRSEAVATALLGAILMVASFGAVSALFGLSLQAGAGLDESVTLLAALFSVVLVGLLVFDLNEGISTLLADSDLDLLRRAPLGSGTLLAVKLLDALPRTSLLLVSLAVPAALAFFTNYPPAAWGWLLAPIQILALWCVPVGLGAAAALGLLRVVPARLAREALGLVSTIALLGVWLANSFLLPRVAEWPETSLVNMRALLGHAYRAVNMSPGGWLAEAMRAAAEADAHAAGVATSKLLLAALGSLALAAWMATLHLETVQSRILSGSSGRVARRSAPRASTASASLHRAFVGRDARLTIRNWTVLADLLTTAALWTLLPIVVAPVFAMPSPVVARVVLVALAVAVGNEVGSRTIPLERDAIVWARLAPVRPMHWVLARTAGAAGLAAALVLATITGVANAFHTGLADLAVIVSVILPALACSLAIGVWCGAAFGDPGWTNPRAMLGLNGRVISTCLLGGQVLVWLLVSTAAAMAPTPQTRWTIVIAAAAVAALGCTVALRLAARRLATRET